MILETDISKLLKWLDDSHIQENTYNKEKSRIEKQICVLNEELEKVADRISKNMKNRNLIIARINELKR